MSYQGKRHYAYIHALEQLSLEQENMQLNARDVYHLESKNGRVRRGRHRRKRLREKRMREERERREQSRERERRERERREQEQAALCALYERASELGERLRPYVAASLKSCMREPTFGSRIAFTWEDIRSAELNFHGGISYRLNPLDTLKMVSASSVFGEPQYYRDGVHERARMLCGLGRADELRVRRSLALLDPYKGLTTAQVMERVIDEALDTDFGATLEWAIELRERYQMRLNPQVILVRAAAHPNRAAWTQEHPGEFACIAERVMSRGDDVTNQVRYWLEGHGDKQGIPAILKRAWARRVGGMNAYTMAKYGNAGIGLVDVVRICHAKGPLVDTLMHEGRVPMPDGQNTWERLRSSGMGWAEILRTIRMPHMALLRNLCGIFSEVEDPQVRAEALALLKRGVRRGRQLPFRYLLAWKAAEEACAPWTRQVQEALEECMGTACANLPLLPGRSAFLTDVSGSMWSTFTSTYGSMRMSEVASLSSVIGAIRAEEGTVFPFADRMARVAIHKDGGVLEQAELVGKVGESCGCWTENPFKLFLSEALAREESWDNIFVYSDMQAGHQSARYYDDQGSYRTLDSPSLIETYRQWVNPKVNVYCIQVGGYTNSLMPEYGYRSTNLCGWTGKELVFADAMNRTWDEVESREPGQHEQAARALLNRSQDCIILLSSSGTEPLSSFARFEVA